MALEYTGMKKLLIILLAAIVLVSGCSTGKVTDAPKISGQNGIGNNVGDFAPDFSVTATDGKIVNLNGITKNNKPIVLYFGATWCPFCSEDLGVAKSVYPKYQKDIEFLYIDLDIGETSELLEKYKEKKGFIGDFAAGYRQVLSDYSAIRTTTKYAIDKTGKIIYKGSGVFTEKDWQNLFDALLLE